MEKRILRKPPTAVWIMMVVVVLLVGFTLAWLTVGDAITDRIYSLSNFDAYSEVYFDGAAEPLQDYRNADGSLNVDIDNPSAENYIGKLRADAYYKGRGAAYMRLKTVQQWTDASGTVLQADVGIPYALGTTWFDNRGNDQALYYADRYSGANNTTYDTIPIIIAGFDQTAFAATRPQGTVTLRLSFEFEAVQVNRYPQFWGIDSLPWTD